MINAVRAIERENARCSREWQQLIVMIGPNIGGHELAQDLAERQGARLKALNEKYDLRTPWTKQ